MLYKVGNYAGVPEQIRALIEHSTASGIRSIVVAALKEMVLHLQTHASGGVVYHAVLDPIIIRYVVFEEIKSVFIKEIKPLPGLPFDRI